MCVRFRRSLWSIDTLARISRVGLFRVKLPWQSVTLRIVRMELLCHQCNHTCSLRCWRSSTYLDWTKGVWRRERHSHREQLCCIDVLRKFELHTAISIGFVDDRMGPTESVALVFVLIGSISLVHYWCMHSTVANAQHHHIRQPTTQASTTHESNANHITRQQRHTELEFGSQRCAARTLLVEARIPY
jgi:hypothetical protein